MTPSELAAICASLGLPKTGYGGQAKLAAITGYNIDHISRMIKGTRAITDRAVIVIRAAIKGVGE